MVWILAAAAAVLAAVALVYNGFVRLREKADSAWADIDVQLRRRHDLVPNLVETVKGYATHERDTLGAVVEARSAAMSAEGPEERGRAEDGLAGALRSLFALSEGYPDLKASRSFLGLQESLTEIEDHLQKARRYYNAVVRDYNIRVRQVPTNVVARAFGFGPREFFQAGERARAVPGVELGLWLVLLGLAAGCATVLPGDPGPEAVEEVRVPPPPGTALLLEEVHERIRAPGLEERTFSPEAWWELVETWVGASDELRMEEVGRSAEDRPLRLVSFGDGPVPVLLWSQMHGDESTASMTLADLFRWVAEEPDHPFLRDLGARLTVHVVPILNPDGAARFQRRNAQGVDVNRDARALATPEGRTLKAVRDRFEPAFGFNLHDQAVGTRVGNTDRGTAIALLAPPFNEARDVNPVRRRAMEVSAVIRTALEPHVGGYMARWDDTFNPRAFGDLMTQWGTSTILIESGGWEGDPEKQFLRKMNFIGILVALDAIAHEAYSDFPVELYSSLPRNGRRVGDLLIRDAVIAVPGLAPLPGDVLVNFHHPLAERGARWADVGDLAEAEARDTIFVSGLYLVPLEEGLERGVGQGPGGAGGQLAPGTPAHFVLSRDPEGRDVVWELRGDVDPERPRPPQGRPPSGG